jgi:hypothetical protein
MSTYEKQLRWKKAILSLSKAAQIREGDGKEDQNKSLFTPQYFSAPIQDFEGTAKQATERSSQIHIARQSKARKEKKEQQDRMKWSEKRKPTEPSTRVTSPSINFQDDNSNAMNYENSGYPDSGGREREGRNSAYQHDDPEHQHQNQRRSMIMNDRDYEGVTPVVELLERERKEWQMERLKLIHCIHLQQLELSQRSAAAHERATDIAKEFARAIEGFEERLLGVELTVQKEIMAIKIIAESIRAAVSVNITNH